MSKGLEINVEMGLCTKEMAKENPTKDFEILIEEHKNKWSTQMYDYFKECLNEIKKELEAYYELESMHEELAKAYNKLCQEKLEWLKQKKALEILKTKRPVIWDEIVKWENYDEYLEYLKTWNIPLPEDKVLTSYEWNLLKEVLL